MMNVVSHLAAMILAGTGPDQHVYNHPFAKTESGLWSWSGNMGNLGRSGISLIIGGPLVGGVYYFVLRCLRGEALHGRQNEIGARGQGAAPGRVGGGGPHHEHAVRRAGLAFEPAQSLLDDRRSAGGGDGDGDSHSWLPLEKVR